MTVSAKLSIDTDIIDAIKDAVKQSPRAIDALMNGSIRNDTKQRLLKALSVTPGPVVLPVEWETDKQRKAFFASNGFGRGFGAKRTGEISNAWELEGESKNGTGDFIIFNPKKAAQYLYGPRQQRFHIQTGWIGESQIDAIIREESEKTSDALILGWFSISDFKGTLA